MIDGRGKLQNFFLGLTEFEMTDNRIKKCFFFTVCGISDKWQMTKKIIFFFVIVEQMMNGKKEKKIFSYSSVITNDHFRKTHILSQNKTVSKH